MTETAAPPDVFGSTVFCDDIRFEVGGKMSLVGVYEGNMRVHTPFPITLPKLGFAISLWQKREIFRPIRGFKLFFPGDMDGNPSVDAQVEGEQPSRSDVPGDGKLIALKTALIISTVTIQQAGAIRARIDFGDILFPVGMLNIEAALAQNEERKGAMGGPIGTNA